MLTRYSTYFCSVVMSQANRTLTSQRESYLRDLTTTAVFFSVGVGREELLDLLDALYQGRQQFREAFERDCSLGERVSNTGTERKITIVPAR